MKNILLAMTMVLSTLAASASSAQEVIGSYVAYVGYADLFNSKGQRLTEPWQVLRQERANYHRFNIRQQGDEWDPFFGSIENRAAMEQMVISGWIDPVAANGLVNGNVFVFVEIWGSGNRGDYVRVSVGN